MSDRRLSEVLGCQDHDLPLVDNVAPAYAHRQVEQANEEAHTRIVVACIAVFVVVVAICRFWVWPGVSADMTRAEMAQGEGR